MSYSLYRVPLDFDLPIGQTWWDHVPNPHSGGVQCKACVDRRGASNGVTPEFQKLEDQWWGYAEFDPVAHGSTLLTRDTPAVRAFAERNVTNSPGYYGTGEAVIAREADRLAALWNCMWLHHLNDEDIAAVRKKNGFQDWTHEWVPKPGVEGRFHPVPKAGVEFDYSKEAVQALSILDWRWGNGQISAVLGAAAKRLGIETTCPVCEGHGAIWKSKAARKRHLDWKRPEVPKGDGWQMWNNVSDVPVSPVFADAHSLARFMVRSFEHNRGYNLHQWLKFILGDGFSMSAVGTADGRLIDGLAYAMGPKITSTEDFECT